MNITGQDSFLSIRDLSKIFTVGKKQLEILRRINLEIGKSEFVSIVGGSGCGKSTLLRIIGGLERNFSGSVLLKENPVKGPGIDRGIVFQEHRLFPWLTVEENIAFGLSEESYERREQKVREQVKLVKLNGFEKAYPHQLSGGMSQRAAIARAIVNQPEILLLDEPFGALDAFTKIQMHEEVLRIREADHTTMILVTHDIDEAIYLGDRVVVMSNRPGTVRRIFKINLPRPRDRNSDEFVRIRRKIYEEFFGQVEVPFAYAI